ncbi:hypothetical protein HU727_012800 [Pseudomonas sp. SWRI153]|uniref:Uncharacterized protein n=1 Tax=Pseudomonas khorasanensis TaxID=2745508 RepID=A0A923F3T8_9PSED|nr:hypothetical protein [Pseudomonas khorasanensis]
MSAIKLSPVLFSFLSDSKFGHQCFHLFDVLLLRGFVSATEQDDQSFALLYQIDSVPGSPVDSVFTEAINHLILEVLPISNRAKAVETLAAACTLKVETQRPNGLESSSCRYSSSVITVGPEGNK